MPSPWVMRALSDDPSYTLPVSDRTGAILTRGGWDPQRVSACTRTVHTACDPVACRDAAEEIAAEGAREMCSPGHAGH